MAPPGYGDLGKKCADLLSKDFHPGKFKFDAKSTTSNGLKLATGGVRDMESGKLAGTAEMTASCSDYGLKYVEKWNTDNDVVVDISVEDKLVKGLKTSFVSAFNPSSGKRRGTIKASYKNDYATNNTDINFDYAGPVVNSSTVLGYKGYLFGHQMAFDSSKKQLSQNNFSASYDNGSNQASVTVNNLQDASASYFHKCSDRVEAGVSCAYSAGSGSAVGNVAAKCIVSPDTSLKMKVSTESHIGLSLKQKITDSVSMTLSSVLDAKNFAAGGHRVGMYLEFEQ